MRKQVFRRGTAAYRLAKAQGRLPSQKAAKKKTAKSAPKETPASKASTPKGNGNKSTTRTGSPGSTKAKKKTPKATTSSNTRTGAKGKKSRDTRLFKGKFTSRGNRPR